jgi:pimeloyl-ACP methyl ester carboxylesterase
MERAAEPRQAAVRSKKSTNGRSAVLPWIQRGVGALQAVSPDAAARATAHLFFRTQRSAPRTTEREVLSTAAPFTVPFAGQRIAAWSWGRGPTVLLVHGWNGRGTQLHAFVAPIVAAGLRAVAFDHVGHGASSGSSTTIVQMSELVTAMARVTGGAHGIVAHSLGAGASAVAMHDGLSVARAVLNAPPLSPEPWIRGLGAMLGLDERTQALTRAEVERRVGRTVDALHVPTLGRALEARGLVVHDEGDREIPLSAGRALAQAWPGAQLHVTKGLGHHRVLTAPEVVDAVAGFLTT